MDGFASAAGATSGFCAILLEGLVYWLADLPGALRSIAHPSNGWLVTLFCGGLITAILFRSGRYASALLCGLLIVSAEATRPLFVSKITGESRITFLAVGHGDAAVLELPGAVILIDAGDSPRIARNIIVPFLQYRGISRLDMVMITHPDRDHYGGVSALLDLIPVDLIVAPPETNDEEDESVTWNCLRDKAQRLSIPWTIGRAGQRVYTGRRDSLWLIAPDTAHPDLVGADKNDRSLVALLRTARTDILFTGDIEHAGQRALAATWPLWRGTWLKAPHHGSDRTTMPCFLHAVAAPHAIVSCGGRRGFPGPDVMDAFTTLNTRTAVTKVHGAVTWTFGRSESRETRHIPALPAN
jgi:competence protein ComEC